jgi:hypothetical protein
MSPDNNNLVSCPYCGAEIKIKSAACPHCGSDTETGWSSNTYLDSIDIPDELDESSYEEIRRSEFGNGGRHHSMVNSFLFVLTASLLLAVIAAGVFLVLR